MRRGMPHIALVTASAARKLDQDLAPLQSALRQAGANVTIAAWDEEATDWSRFDLALLRSTWDYAQRVSEFLDWTARVARCTRLSNPPELVRWNIDKHYLAQLQSAGVPIVPGMFVEPGDDAEAALTAFFQAYPQARDFVIKPCIGAGSRDAQRHHGDARGRAAAHLRYLLDSRRSALLQPYLHGVDEQGETALLFFDGAFSHAIRKGPLLKRGAEATPELFAAEHITPRAASPEEIDLAQRALRATPFEQPLLYARVDLIRDESGSPCLLELELIEPSVFLDHAPDAAGRFAQAILRRAARHGATG